MKRHLKLGTRGSALALIQTELVIAALKARHPRLVCEIVKIVTSGDKTQGQNLPLPENSGGKGLFLKEIEEALLRGDIDCAVHSMKDVPGHLPPGLAIPYLLPREDPRDAFFSNKAKDIDSLPQGAVVGSTSPRRAALLLARRPDLKIVTFRGNVDTRLKKLDAGDVDATLLAVAGLKRLGQEHRIRSILEPDVMLPAVAQGAIGVEVRENDAATAALLSPIHCAVTGLRVTAERAFLKTMDGSCRTPLAALMSEPDTQGRARFEALAASPDGRKIARVQYMMAVQSPSDAERLGRKAAEDVQEQMA